MIGSSGPRLVVRCDDDRAVVWTSISGISVLFLTSLHIIRATLTRCACGIGRRGLRQPGHPEVINSPAARQKQVEAVQHGQMEAAAVEEVAATVVELAGSPMQANRALKLPPLG